MIERRYDDEGFAVTGLVDLETGKTGKSLRLYPHPREGHPFRRLSRWLRSIPAGYRDARASKRAIR